VKLYDYWRSSSAWRVRIALAYKGIPYQRQAVNLIRAGGGEQNEAPFAAVNPLSQVPVLELDAGEGGTAGVLRIAQSLPILEFLEERFPSPALLPGDPWRRARSRQLAEMINAGIQPLHNMSTLDYVKNRLGGDASGWMQHFIGRGLAALETIGAETAATFLVGEAISFADVYLIPQLYVARRFAVPLDGYPTLLRTEAACTALPAFEAAHADRQPDKP
jgi:maleylpyruvate isomerase